MNYGQFPPPPQVYQNQQIQNTTVVNQPAPQIVQSPGIAQVVFTQQPTAPAPASDPEIIIKAHLTEVPGQIKCPNCKKQIVTETRFINGKKVWVVFGSLCIFLIWPCCLIPFCLNSCKDVEHHCPNCKSLIDVYKRI